MELLGQMVQTFPSLYIHIAFQKTVGQQKCVSVPLALWILLGEIDIRGRGV